MSNTPLNVTWFADLRRARAALRERRITPAAMATWLVVTQGFKRQSHAQIAQDLGGRSIRQVIRWIAELEAAELLAVGRRGAKRVNDYWVKPASRPRVVGGRDAQTYDTGVTSPVTPESPFLPLCSNPRVESKRPIRDALEKEEAALLAAYNARADQHGWEHAYDVNQKRLAGAIAEAGGPEVLIAAVAGIPAQGLRRGKPVTIGLVLDPRFRAQLLQRAERARKAAAPENPWIHKVARQLIGSYGWDDCSDGPKPGQPGCKAKFDVEAVVARVESWFRDTRFRDRLRAFAGREDDWEASMVPVVGAKHARRLMDIVRQRASEAA